MFTYLGSNNSISTTATYDAFGNILTATDAKGTQSQITYGSINSYSDLYPTQTKTALGKPEERTSTAVYDFNTGLVITAKDVDNNVESKTEYDDLGRPTKIIGAYGDSTNEIWTQTEYDDTLRRVITKSDLEVKGDAKKVAIQHFDELGRVRLARVIEDIATEDPTDEEDGIKVQTRYRYDDGDDPANSDGVYSLTSNPYRATKSTLATNEDTMGWSVSYAPKDGKYSESETFSGASLPAPFVTSNANTNSTGIVRTDTDANRTLVTDQSGKKRISKTNALGHLTDVWEVKVSDSDTESISFPTDSSITHAYKTSYSYDTLNNLTTVNQGQQTRTFTYNSLSRLKTATNPESGTISYVYDDNGNLTSKTDARSITTTYVYDNINRVTKRSYSDGITPEANYTYDNVTNAKGQLTKVVTGIPTSPFSTTEYQVFDKVGRVTQSQQTTDGETYNPMTYTYNLSGAMIEQTYPSGRVVKNVIDNDGMLSAVQSKKDANSGYFNYANSFTFNATGAVESMQLGNGKWESTTFNSRLQPTQIALGTTQGGTDKLKLDYEYNSSGQNDNNGNVLKQTITVSTVGTNNGFDAVQTYTYDELNRLKSATENIDGSTTASWKQTFTYDRYGNRNFDKDNTTTLTKSCGTTPNFTVCTNDRKAENSTISPTNNRIIEDQDNDQVDDYKFDLAGNTTEDVGNNRFTYDGENKQIKVETIDANGNVTGIVGEYWYDGDGKRVKKKVGTDITIFVYNGSGQLVAEYATQTSQTPKVSYLTNDHLGSPRITTDMDGDVYTRRDFMPFGEEIDIDDTPERKTELNYASDEIRQKFTTYERDGETELDFAQARMHNYNLGRFTSPDPVKITKSRLSDPQAINLYVYGRNNPILYIDPLGLDILIAHKTLRKAKEAYRIFQLGLNKTDRKKTKFVIGTGKNGYTEGEFGIVVDQNHQSKSDNFKSVQKISGDSETVEFRITEKNEDIAPTTYFTETDSKGNKTLISVDKLLKKNGFKGADAQLILKKKDVLGIARFSTKNKVVSGGSYKDGNTDVLVNPEASDVEKAATAYHEFRHVSRSNIGRNLPKGLHGSDPNFSNNSSNGLDKDAEREARRNAQIPYP